MYEHSNNLAVDLPALHVLHYSLLYISLDTYQL